VNRAQNSLLPIPARVAAGVEGPPVSASLSRGRGRLVEPAPDDVEPQEITEDLVFALVYRQVRKLAGKRDDVEELTQLAAEQVLRSLPSFEGRSRLSTWTFRICYLTIRKHDRWYRRWLRRFTLTVDGELPEPVAGGAGADARFARKEQLGRLQAALEGLSAKRRAVVVMHDLEGLSIEEIASVVGAEPVAVRSRLRDGRKVLAALLADDPYFGDEACLKGGKR
jgi:RNA polymerase sigma factor (sigma-70 family)